MNSTSWVPGGGPMPPNLPDDDAHRKFFRVRPQPRRVRRSSGSIIETIYLGVSVNTATTPPEIDEIEYDRVSNRWLITEHDEIEEIDVEDVLVMLQDKGVL